MPVIFLWVFGSFACLFPLALYCLTVAGWNNRRRPTFLSGPADFAGVLLATAGFLIVGGPLVLMRIPDVWERSVLRGQDFAVISAFFAESPWPWAYVWVGYFVLVVGGSIWLLWRRRAVSVVYNFDVATAHALIATVLQNLGLPFVRRGAVYYLGFGASEGRAGLTAARAVLHVTAIPALRNVTLRWSNGGRLTRAAFESEFCDALSEVEMPANPAGRWLMAAATALFTMLFVMLALFIFVLWTLRR